MFEGRRPLDVLRYGRVQVMEISRTYTAKYLYKLRFSRGFRKLFARFSRAFREVNSNFLNHLIEAGAPRSVPKPGPSLDQMVRTTAELPPPTAIFEIPTI